ncbi:MAG: hypothetical protein PWR01_4141 [Clostridiales bacterium]|jgi:2'-5' RNA ligase|nr:hypothetical protein [Clostridiales bacterium]MDN5283068.1 hypothetical protein [Candidatus Ozemobacter sp.]
MIPLRHFLVLFFDEASKAYLNSISRKLYAGYCPGRPFPEIEHHLTVHYFQCDEPHYPKIIEEIELKTPRHLPVEVNIKSAYEYVNELNDFCSISLLAEKKGEVLRLHKELTRPLEKYHLHYEPWQDWPPHITCFPGLKLKDRPKNWHAPQHLFSGRQPVLNGIELRLTRWSGTHIETIHRFK